MLRRTMMRRAYNSGRWKRARHLALKIVNKPREAKLARSVIIRSHWNEGNYQKVVELNQEWNGEFNHFLEKQSSSEKIFGVDGKQILSPKVQQWHSEQPTPSNTNFEFDNVEMSNNFHQEGERVWMCHPHGWTYWDMPPDFSLKNTHVDLLRLTAEILLYPWHPNSRQDMEGSRIKGTMPALSFSAGTDSTAASLVMPSNTILGYHRRSVKSILDHRNADRLLKYLETENRQIADIVSNHELIRTYHFKQIGFSSDFACATHLILLSDMYDIGAIAFGMPLDNTYLWKGRKFRQFREIEYFQYWSKRFELAGLDLVLPIAGVSEAGALKICANSEIIQFMNSCLRGDGKSGCGSCWKCFHKNGPLGRPFDIKSREIQTFLNRRPLPTATHVLWALKELNLGSEVPDLTYLLEADYSWWTMIYPPSKDLLPLNWVEEIWDNLCSNLDLMTEPFLLEQIDHFSESANESV
jgi:hypothetical protein